MAYQRKTKDVYFLYWNGEEIDSTENRQEAKRLQIEYALAFKSAVYIKKRRVKK